MPSDREEAGYSLRITAWWSAGAYRGSPIPLPNIANTPAFGLFYGAHVEALTGSEEDPTDPDAVSRACYVAAAIYAGFIGFCGLQVSSSPRISECDWRN
jgi:hypothetical protein